MFITVENLILCFLFQKYTSAKSLSWLNKRCMNAIATYRFFLKQEYGFLEQRCLNKRQDRERKQASMQSIVGIHTIALVYSYLCVFIHMCSYLHISIQLYLSIISGQNQLSWEKDIMFSVIVTFLFFFFSLLFFIISQIFIIFFYSLHFFLYISLHFYFFTMKNKNEF